MIILEPASLKRVVDAAEAAYPEECCGLLVGASAPSGDIVVSRVEPSRNVARRHPERRFEVDPQVRFEVMHALEGGIERIVGHYHSHPGGAAQPSGHDLDMAWEPDLVWLITAVLDGQAVHTTAHVLDAEGRRFREVGLRTSDRQPGAVRAPPADGGAGDKR